MCPRRRRRYGRHATVTVTIPQDAFGYLYGDVQQSSAVSNEQQQRSYVYDSRDTFGDPY